MWKRFRAIYYIFSLSYGRSVECHRVALPVLRTDFSNDIKFLERLDNPTLSTIHTKLKNYPYRIIILTNALNIMIELLVDL